MFRLSNQNYFQAIKFRAQAIFNWLSFTQPPGFQNFKFLNFSVYTTLLVPKQPISIKNFIHCGALQSRRAISGLYSFFYTPCIYTGWPKKKYSSLVQHILGAVHMSRASPANRADSILSPLMGA